MIFHNTAVHVQYLASVPKRFISYQQWTVKYIMLMNKLPWQTIDDNSDHQVNGPTHDTNLSSR